MQEKRKSTTSEKSTTSGNMNLVDSQNLMAGEFGGFMSILLYKRRIMRVSKYCRILHLFS